MSEIKTPIHIRVQVKTNAHHERVESVSENKYKISVKEPAEDNLANKKVLEIIHGMYPNKIVKLVKGHHTPNKTFEIV